jgi:hypothetical protein
LRQHKILDLGRYIQAATIAPDGLRFCFRDRINNELMVARIADGEILARTPLIIGGTGSELGWSADGRLIGAVSSDGFRFFMASNLASVGCETAQYPSSVAFRPRFRGQRLTEYSSVDSRLSFGGGLGRAGWAEGRRVGDHRGIAAA